MPDPILAATEWRTNGDLIESSHDLAHRLLTLPDCPIRHTHSCTGRGLTVRVHGGDLSPDHIVIAADPRKAAA